MPEVSLVMTLRDRVSNTMKSIMNSGKALSKEWDELYERVSTAENQQAALEKELAKTRTSLTQQTDAVKKAKTEWDVLRRSEDASADAISEKAAAYQEATEKLESLKNQLNQYTEASRDARAEVKELTSEYRNLRKASSDLGDAGPGSSLGSGSGILEKLRDAGLTKMLGDSISQAANLALESFAGQSLASTVSSTLSGAFTGYALGGLPGAGIGALAGGINGLTQIYTAQDDAFKSYYQEAIQTVMDEQANAITSGSAIAGSREQTQIAFAKRLGSDEAAAAYLDQVKAMAGNTNYSYDEITGYSKLLLNSYSANETFGVLQKLSDATAGLDLSSSDVSAMIDNLSRMRTTGKATQEHLNAFSDRGVDVYSALAGFAGGDRSKVREMISGGKIGGVEAAQAILDYIEVQFGGLSGKLAQTYDGMVANLEDAEANLQAAAGEGYNEEHKKGIDAHRAWMESNTGLEDAYKAIGQWEASLENTKMQMEREALDAVMTGTIGDMFTDSDQRARLEELAQEYQAALADKNAGVEGAGDKLGKLLVEAKVIAMNEYNASEGAQLALQSELALADKIREDTASNEAYWNAGHRKGQEYSKGLVAGLPELKSSFDNALSLGERLGGVYGGTTQDTATTSGVSVQINGLSVREDADIDKIAAAILEGLQIARMAG